MGFSKSSSRCTHFLQVIPPTCGRRHPTKPLNPLVVIFLFLFSLNLETIRHVVDSRKRYVKRFYLCGRSSWDSLSSAFDRRRAPGSYYFPTLEKSSVEGQSFRDKFKKGACGMEIPLFLFFHSAFRTKRLQRCATCDRSTSIPKGCRPTECDYNVPLSLSLFSPFCVRQAKGKGFHSP